MKYIQVSILFVWMMLVTVMASAAGNKLETWKAPEGIELNSDFKVMVRCPGQEWNMLSSYLVKVDEVKGTKHNAQPSSAVTFGFSGEVEVKVVYQKGNISTARVRPLSCGIAAQINGNELTFSLTRTGSYSVEVNGDIFHNLQLFANPLETEKPKKKAKNVIYFGPGVHEIEGGEFRIPSGKTVYVAGGAVLKGRLLMDSVENVRVMGRGIVDYTVREGIKVSNSKNIQIEGLLCTQCPVGGSDGVTIRNVKVISYYGWGDGMNVFASNNVLYEDVFCRTSDDCTTVYATRKGFVGGCKNIVMRRAVLWADVAHPIFIGLHGNTPNPETIENVAYEDIDILDHQEKQLNYQGCMAINAGDNNLVRNIRFENIRIEDFRQGQLVNLRIFMNPKYCTAPGRGIENILFKDIEYNGTHAELSIIEGYSAERMVKNIKFKNLRINGTVISDDMEGKPAWYATGDMARIYSGPFVENVTFER